MYPVHFNPEYRLFFGPIGAWQVSDYEDVKAVLDNPEIFSSEILPCVPGFALSYNIAQTDPPAHARLKKHLSKAFMESVNALPANYITQEAEQLVAAALDGNIFDFVSRIAQQLPLKVTSRIIGINTLHHNQVFQWISRIISPPLSAEEVPKLVEAQQQMQGFLKDQIDQHKTASAADLIGVLTASKAQDALTPEEILSACMAVYMAGHETTANLLTNLIHTVAVNDELQDHLHKEPNLAAAAVEESLRFFGPVRSVVRVLKQDTDLFGLQMNKGEFVVAWIAHANHDPATFSAPDQFDLHRHNVKDTLSFGHGIHGCIGAMLGKAQALAILSTLLHRTRQINIASGSTLYTHPSDLIQGFINLPLTCS